MCEMDSVHRGLTQVVQNCQNESWLWNTPGRADWHISCRDYAGRVEWPQVCWRPPDRRDRWDVCAASWLLGLPLLFHRRCRSHLRPAGWLVPLAVTWLQLQTSPDSVDITVESQATKSFLSFPVLNRPITSSKLPSRWVLAKHYFSLLFII